MNKCSPSNITYTANPNYWQPGEPKIKKIEYPAYTSNTTANDDLANGTAQWGAQYIPGINTFYKSKSPNYNYWFPPTVNVSLVPNLTNPLLSNVKVRQAMSYAIDRSQGLHHRRVRLRAACEPDRHRHADVLQLPKTTRPCEPGATAMTRPRRSRCWPRPASTWAPTAS